MFFSESEEQPKGHLFASEKRYSLTLPLLAGQEKTLTSPSHSESAEKYTISNEGKANRRNRSKESQTSTTLKKLSVD